MKAFKTMKSFQVIIIYGPPGSGKGTQANRVARHFHFKHLDTGQLIERVIYQPEKQTDPLIQRERANFEQGRLCSPEWVTQIIEEEIRSLAQKGQGIVFSGSPRTLYEAKRIIPLLIELYGQEQIAVLELVIKPATSILRNSHRLICQQCGQPLVYSPENEQLTRCPYCQGKLTKRVLDKPAIIKVRLKEYQERTKPIYQFLKKQGLRVIKIDGEPQVEEVFKNILAQLNDSP